MGVWLFHRATVMNLRRRVTTTDHSSHSGDRINRMVNFGTVWGGAADAANIGQTRSSPYICISSLLLPDCVRLAGRYFEACKTPSRRRLAVATALEARHATVIRDGEEKSSMRRWLKLVI